MNWGKLVNFLSILILGIFVVACSANEDTNESNDSTNANEEEPIEETEEEQQVPEKPEKIEQEITVSAIGDMLIHNSVYQDANTGNGYDFTTMLEAVKPTLNDTTLSFANQETMIGGDALGLSSYPTFNSPKEVGDALKWAGVDVVALANNHTLDRGEEAIQNAIDHWETIDMMYTGAYKDQEDRENIRVYETDEGISIAFLAYTYGTNGIPVPEGKDYLVNLIEQEMIASDIARAKEQADVVALSLHFGNEYERMPSEQQKELVQFAADQGVHVVLGHHPHVLQPVDWVRGEEGNKMFVAYSLGNFLSGQDEFYRRIGGVVKFSIKKTIEGEEETIEVTSPQFMPTFVEYENWRNYKVTPMYQLTDSDLSEADRHYQEIKDHMSQWVPELEFMEE
ncbi:CapA family protein [Virgibacillus byunsanensis]|uniref:CapA family protein n=1 Tax=Virgibacillus byunsanensis TaxID=570945 RepID=A0ABW3LIY0_9BACI